MLLFAILGLTFTSCYTWKRGFVTENKECFQKCKQKRIDKTYSEEHVDTLNPTDFFYLRQVEYFEFIDNDSSANNNQEPYINEVSAALYKSVPVGYKLKRSERVVEEKYMCVDGLSDDSLSGMVYYFRTATYWGEGRDNGEEGNTDIKLRPSKLKEHYSSDTEIDLSTSKKLQIGYWERDADTLYLFMNDGEDLFEVKAILKEHQLNFMEISHPNKEGSGKDTNSEQYIELKKVMNVQNNPGLVYYRNSTFEKVLRPKRDISITYVENGRTFKKKIFSICYQSKRMKWKNLDSGISEITLEDKTTLEERKKYHETTVVNKNAYQLIQKTGIIPSSKDIRKSKREKRRAERASGKSKK